MAHREPPPPWLAFPHLGADSFPPRQGSEEAWTDTVWRPFWLGLSPHEREAYLAKWDVGPTWREALKVVDLIETLDLEEDARESERYLAEHAADDRELPFWRRWLGGKEGTR